MMNKLSPCLYALLFMFSVVNISWANQSEEQLTLEQAAQRGDSQAQYQLGYYFEFHEDRTKRNFILASQWYEKAARRGHFKAASQLAWMYELGKGVARNKSMALYWMVFAANEGDVQAQKDLVFLQRRYEQEGRRQRVQKMYSVLVNELRRLRKEK